MSYRKLISGYALVMWRPTGRLFLFVSENNWINQIHVRDNVSEREYYFLCMQYASFPLQYKETTETRFRII